MNRNKKKPMERHTLQSEPLCIVSRIVMSLEWVFWGIYFSFFLFVINFLLLYMRTAMLETSEDIHKKYPVKKRENKTVANQKCKRLTHTQWIDLVSIR